MKYSIIIPHFNRPDLIMDCINSFNNLKDKEIIIIDDCSTKENLHQLKLNLKSLDSSQNVTLYETSEKLYLSKARNRGIDLAQGKWIFFIDDDDEATEKFISFLNSKKLKDDIDFYRFSVISLLNGKKDRIIRNRFIKNRTYSVQVSTYLIKKEYLKNNKIRFYDEEVVLFEDSIFNMQIYFPKKKNICYTKIPSIYYKKNDHVESLIRRKEPKISEKFIKGIDATLSFDSEWNVVNSLRSLCFYFFDNYKNKKIENTKENLDEIKKIYKKINPKIKDFFMFSPKHFFIILRFVFYLKTHKK